MSVDFKQLASFAARSLLKDTGASAKKPGDTKKESDKPITIVKDRSWYMDKQGRKRLLSDRLDFKINSRHAGFAGLVTTISTRRFKHAEPDAYKFIKKNLNNPLVRIHHARLEKLALRINNLSREGKLKELRTARRRMKTLIGRLGKAWVGRKLAFIGKYKHEIDKATVGSLALLNLGVSFNKRTKPLMTEVQEYLGKDPLKWNMPTLRSKLDRLMLRTANFRQEVVFVKMMKGFLDRYNGLRKIPGYKKAHREVIKRYKKAGKFKQLKVALKALRVYARAGNSGTSDDDLMPVILARTAIFFKKHRPVLDRYAMDVATAATKTAEYESVMLNNGAEKFLADAHGMLKDLKGKDPKKRAAAFEKLKGLMHHIKVGDVTSFNQSILNVPEAYVNFDAAAIDDRVAKDTFTSYETLDDDASHVQRRDLQDRIDGDQAFAVRHRARLERQHSVMNYICEYIAKAKKVDSKVLAIAAWVKGASRDRFIAPLRKNAVARDDLGRKEYALQQGVLDKLASSKTPKAFMKNYRKAAFIIQTGRMLLAYKKLEEQNDAIAKAKKSTNRTANFFLGCYYATFGIHKTAKALFTGNHSDIVLTDGSNDPMNAAEDIREGREQVLKARKLFAKGLTEDNAEEFQRLIADSARHLKDASDGVKAHGSALSDIAWADTAGAIAVLVAAVVASAMTAGYGGGAVVKLAGGSRILYALFSTAVASSSFHVAHTLGEMAVFGRTPTMKQFFRGAGKQFALFLVAGQAMRGLNKLMGVEAAATESAARVGFRARIGAMGRSYGLSKHAVKILEGTVKASAKARAAAWANFVKALATKGSVSALSKLPKWSAHFGGEIGIFMGAEMLIAHAAGEHHQAQSFRDMALMVLLLRRVNRTMEPHVKKITLRGLEKSIAKTRAQVAELIKEGRLDDAARFKLSKRGLRLIAAYRAIKGKGSQGDFGNEFGRWKKMGQEAARRTQRTHPGVQLLGTFESAGTVGFAKRLIKAVGRLSFGEQATIKLALRLIDPGNPRKANGNRICLMRINRALKKIGYAVEGGAIVRTAPTAWQQFRALPASHQAAVVGGGLLAVGMTIANPFASFFALPLFGAIINRNSDTVAPNSPEAQAIYKAHRAEENARFARPGVEDSLVKNYNKRNRAEEKGLENSEKGTGVGKISAIRRRALLRDAKVEFSKPKPVDGEPVAKKVKHTDKPIEIGESDIIDVTPPPIPRKKPADPFFIKFMDIYAGETKGEYGPKSNPRDGYYADPKNTLITGIFTQTKNRHPGRHAWWIDLILAGKANQMVTPKGKPAQSPVNTNTTVIVVRDSAARKIVIDRVKREVTGSEAGEIPEKYVIMTRTELKAMELVGKAMFDGMYAADGKRIADLIELEFRAPVKKFADSVQDYLAEKTAERPQLRDVPGLLRSNAEELGKHPVIRKLNQLMNNYELVNFPRHAKQFRDGARQELRITSAIAKKYPELVKRIERDMGFREGWPGEPWTPKSPPPLPAMPTANWMNPLLPVVAPKAQGRVARAINGVKNFVKRNPEKSVLAILALGTSLFLDAAGFGGIATLMLGSVIAGGGKPTPASGEPVTLRNLTLEGDKPVKLGKTRIDRHGDAWQVTTKEREGIYVYDGVKWVQVKQGKANARILKNGETLYVNGEMMRIILPTAAPKTSGRVKWRMSGEKSMPKAKPLKGDGTGKDTAKLAGSGDGTPTAELGPQPGNRETAVRLPQVEVPQHSDIEIWLHYTRFVNHHAEGTVRREIIDEMSNIDVARHPEFRELRDSADEFLDVLDGVDRDLQYYDRLGDSQDPAVAEQRYDLLHRNIESQMFHLQNSLAYRKATALNDSWCATTEPAKDRVDQIRQIGRDMGDGVKVHRLYRINGHLGAHYDTDFANVKPNEVFDMVVDVNSPEEAHTFMARMQERGLMVSNRVHYTSRESGGRVVLHELEVLLQSGKGARFKGETISVKIRVDVEGARNATTPPEPAEVLVIDRPVAKGGPVKLTLKTDSDWPFRTYQYLDPDGKVVSELIMQESHILHARTKEGFRHLKLNTRLSNLATNGRNTITAVITNETLMSELVKEWRAAKAVGLPDPDCLRIVTDALRANKPFLRGRKLLGYTEHEVVSVERFEKRDSEGKVKVDWEIVVRSSKDMTEGEITDDELPEFMRDD